MFEGKCYLITGGAGSLGLALAKQILECSPKAVRLLDVSEYFLYKAQRELKDGRIRMLLGDIRDKERVAMAMRDADYLIHCAAVKSIDIAGYNPLEAIKTNVDGTMALVTEALSRSNLDKFIFISSDKSLSHETQNVYSATKYLGEELMAWANSIQDRTRFASIRMGNFIDSHMNVFETWAIEEARGEPLSLTHPEIRRWFLKTDDAAKYTLEALSLMEGGEIFVAPAEEKRLIDLIGNRPHRITGLRKGERLREYLMSEQERQRAFKKGNLWVVKN